MFKLRILKIKDSLFIVLITLLTVFIYIYGKEDISAFCSDQTGYSITELEDASFSDSISSGVCFVLFYVENSASCYKEMYHLNQIA
jgi:hypothetical protein